MSEEQEVQPSEEPAGLLDSADATDEGQQKPSPESTAVEHRAADQVTDKKAEERPEWWPENFWKGDEPDLEGIAKSWKDMRKMVSQGKHKAPPEGKYDLSSFGDNGEKLPMVPVFQKWAAENGISQTAFDSLAGELTTLAAEAMGQSKFDPVAEKKALGANADSVINGMVNWARGLVNKGVWSVDDFDEFKVMGGTSRGLKALMKLRETYEGRIPTESMPIEGMPTDQELQAMVGDPKYQTDASYRSKVEKMFAARYN
jgi:hypothetical protein